MRTKSLTVSVKGMKADPRNVYDFARGRGRPSADANQRGGSVQAALQQKRQNSHCSRFHQPKSLCDQVLETGPLHRVKYCAACEGNARFVWRSIQ